MLEVVSKYVSSDTISHLWILIDGKIEIAEAPGHKKIHKDVWGTQAWDINERGYFRESCGTVTCHRPIENSLLRKIERAFDKANLCALYFSGPVKSRESDHCVV